MVYNYPEKGYTCKTQTERDVYTEREKKNKEESWHKRRVKKKKEETEKSNHQRISLPDPVAWSGSSVYMEK